MREVLSVRVEWIYGSPKALQLRAQVMSDPVCILEEQVPVSYARSCSRHRKLRGSENSTMRSYVFVCFWFYFLGKLEGF